MNVLETKKGITIVDDSYNANPDSMEAALTTLMNLKGKQRGFFVAGDMFELGLQAESFHKAIGSKAALFDISRLYVTGDYAEAVASGAQEKSMNRRNIFIGTKEAIFDDLKGQLRRGDWILVKGSRAMNMEKIVHRIKTWADD
jgi:UDP-N-acetylmuramyl pentapeptide synthase